MDDEDSSILPIHLHAHEHDAGYVRHTTAAASRQEDPVRKGLRYFSEGRFESMDALLASIVDEAFMPTYQHALRARTCLASFQEAIEKERQGKRMWENNLLIEEMSPTSPARLACEHLSKALYMLKAALLADKLKTSEVLMQVEMLGEFITVLNDYFAGRVRSKATGFNSADGDDDTPHTIVFTPRAR